MENKLQRKRPKEVCDKISLKMQGRKLSDETKRKISKSVKLAWSKVPQVTSTSTQNNMEKNMSGNVQTQM